MPVLLDELRSRPASSSRDGGGATSDVFLHLVTQRTRVKGEATTAGHEDDIEVASWSWGLAANAAVGSTAATGRRVYKQLVVVKGVDAATTPLMSAVANNDTVKQAVLTMRKAGGEALDYFTMSLAGARIVGIDIEVGADGVPRERIAIAFTRIEVQYQPQRAAGGSGGALSFTDDVVAAG